jgi:hypothetical protein
MMAKLWRAAPLAIVVLLAVGCGGASISEWRGRDPVEMIRVQRREVRMALLEGRALADAVDLSVFAGVEPGMQVMEAEQQLRRSANRTTRDRDELYRFSIDGGSIVIERREVSSGDATRWKWELYYLPAHPKPLEVFSAAAAQVRDTVASGRWHVWISSDEGGVGLDVEDGTVRRVFWALRGRKGFEDMNQVVQ